MKMECILICLIIYRAAILCSKYTDPKTFLETMIKNNKNFESYTFNQNYKIHEG